jgi:DNA-binding transcriptional regulator WhiA
MEVADLKKINSDIKNNSVKITDEVLTEVADKLRFSAELDHLFVTEVNIFVHELHKLLAETDYYDEIENDLEEICTLALHLSQNLKVIKAQKTGKKIIPKHLIADMKSIGKILKNIAPNIRTIIGLMGLLKTSDIQFWG